METVRTRSGLEIPKTAGVRLEDLRQQFRCMVPGCGETFPEGHRRAFEQHVAECSSRNMDAIMAESPRVKAPGIFGDVGVDIEYRDWLRKRYHGDGSRRV